MPSSLPVDYGDPAAEYLAASDSCVLFDLTDRSQLEITGADRASFLHNFCSQDIKRLPVGQGAEAFVTNIKGRILGHLLVFAGDDSLWLDSTPGTADGLIAHLDRYLISEDVQFINHSDTWGTYALAGPAAAGIVDQLLPGSGAFAPMQHGHADVDGLRITVRHFSFTRGPGWIVGASKEQQDALRQRLIQAGAKPAGRHAFEALRIESLFPWYGVDISEDNLAQEAGRTREAISFTKGCYLGQEPIARLDALGHTNRELRGMAWQEAIELAPGTPVVNDEGRAVGTVTSSVIVPVGSRTIALGMLRREAGAAGSKIAIERDGTLHEGTVFERE